MAVIMLEYWTCGCWFKNLYDKKNDIQLHSCVQNTYYTLISDTSVEWPLLKDYSTYDVSTHRCAARDTGDIYLLGFRPRSEQLRNCSQCQNNRRRMCFIVWTQYTSLENLAAIELKQRPHVKSAGCSCLLGICHQRLWQRSDTTSMGLWDFNFEWTLPFNPLTLVL